MNARRGPHLALVGQTASGKSEVALDIARLEPLVELVSIDSMQVYRGMDIGTAKPSPQERTEIPHHLIDIADPTEDFSVARFQEAFVRARDDIEARGRRAILVGGTGLYLRSAIDGLQLPGRWPEVRDQLESDPDTETLHARLATLDPLAASRMEATNRRRVVRALEVTIGSGRPFSSFGPGLEAYAETPFFLVGLQVPRPVLAARIAARVHDMVARGFVEEVRRLASAGMSRTARQALGYREILRHVDDGVDLDDCIEEAIRRTRQFARRQEVWFRRDPRITWYDPTENPLAVAEQVLGDWTQRCRP